MRIDKGPALTPDRGGSLHPAPTDAVAQARREVEMLRDPSVLAPTMRGALDAYAAAVRAECADRVTHDNIVADLPLRGARPEAAEYVADVLLCVRKRITEVP